MWIEKRNTKYRYHQKYYDENTDTTKKVSITLSSNSNQAKNHAQRILQQKIDDKLQIRDDINLSLQELFEKWINIYKHNVKDSTVHATRSTFRSLTKRIDCNVKIKKISSSQIQDILDTIYYKENYSYSYIDSLKSLLNTMFKYAVRMDYIKENIIEHVSIKRKKLDEEEITNIKNKFLEPHELKLVLNELSLLKNNTAPNRYVPFLELLSLTGLRYGELASMRYSDYDGKILNVNKTLLYNNDPISAGRTSTPKTDSSYRKILLSDRSIEIIEEFIEENKFISKFNDNYIDKGFIFTTSKGNPIHISHLNSALKKVSITLKQRGLLSKALKTHIFRHAHVADLTALNIPLKTIMERIGHSSSETTLKIYSHVNKEMENNLLHLLNDKEKENT